MYTVCEMQDSWVEGIADGVIVDDFIIVVVVVVDFGEEAKGRYKRCSWLVVSYGARSVAVEGLGGYVGGIGDYDIPG